MPNRLDPGMVERMWEAYREHQSVHEVSKKCGVHRKTVERYRQLDRWDARLDDVRTRAQAEADYDLTRAMADSLRLVRSYKDRLAVALSKKTMSPDEVTANELERIIKLEAYTLGGVESRTEIVNGYSEWTDQELEEYAQSGKLPTGPRRGAA